MISLKNDRKKIDFISNASQVVVSAFSHGLANGDIITIKDVNGISETVAFTLDNDWAIEGYFNFNDNINKISAIKKSANYSVNSDALYNLGTEQSLFKLINDSGDGSVICHVYFKKYNSEGYFGDIIAKCDRPELPPAESPTYENIIIKIN